MTCPHGDGVDVVVVVVVVGLAVVGGGVVAVFVVVGVSLLLFRIQNRHMETLPALAAQLGCSRLVPTCARRLLVNLGQHI
jgi:hypothetical protein